MAIKATHTGHCQICGSGQKLPGGRLAKHGYTVKWGFFSGVCNGSHELPFEQDKSLIEGQIDWAMDKAATLRATAVQDRQNNNPEDVWYNAYFNDYGKGGSRYQWIKTKVYADPQIPARTVYDHPGDSRPAGPRQVGLYGELADVASKMNGLHAAYLEKQAAELDQYVAWQRERIANWTPAPLTPVK